MEWGGGGEGTRVRGSKNMGRRPSPRKLPRAPNMFKSGSESPARPPRSPPPPALPPVACGHSGSTSLPAPLHAPAAFLEALRRFAATGTFCIPFPGHLLSPAEILCLFLSPAQMPQPPGSLPASLPWEGPLCRLEALGHGPVFSLVSQPADRHLTTCLWGHTFLKGKDCVFCQHLKGGWHLWLSFRHPQGRPQRLAYPR